VVFVFLETVTAVVLLYLTIVGYNSSNMKLQIHGASSSSSSSLKAKGSLSLFVLEALCEGAMRASDLLGAFLDAGYGASYGKLRYELSRREAVRALHQRNARAMQRYHRLLYQLKRAGLVVSRPSSKGTAFSLTPRGRDKLGKLRAMLLPASPPAAYTKEESARWIIVMFDIPESERKKRDWLRSVLGRLGFTMKQKSVFIGKAKIPEQFLEDMRKLGIFDNVHILEVTKKGSIEEM